MGGGWWGGERREEGRKRGGRWGGGEVGVIRDKPSLDVLSHLLKWIQYKQCEEILDTALGIYSVVYMWERWKLQAHLSGIIIWKRFTDDITVVAFCTGEEERREVGRGRREEGGGRREEGVGRREKGGERG